jgi:uncharacterized damage-inducible protein DinB
MREYFEKLFEFNYWANSAITECLANQVTNEKETIGLLAHILAAEKLWLNRMVKIPGAQIKVWQSSSIGKCRTMAKENYAAFTEFLSDMDNGKLTEVIEYKTSKGKIFSNKVVDILTQLINHGSHHRSQINLAIRKNGGEPVGIDYITFVREKKKGSQNF